MAFGQASTISSAREPIVVYNDADLNPKKPGYEWTGTTLLRNIRVIDGMGNEPVEGQDVLVANGKIRVVGPTGSLDVPSDARDIDGDGLTVLPGLMDAHAHLFAGWRGGNDNGNRPIEARWQLLTYLYAGVTHIYEIGNGSADQAADARDMVAAGAWMGPDVTIAGQFFETAQVGATRESVVVQTPTGQDIGRHLDTMKDTYGVEMVKCHSGTNSQVLRVLVKEAHARDMRVVCDLWHNNGNPWIARQTHLDGFAHNMFMALAPTTRDAQILRDEGTFVITTMVMFDLFGGTQVKQEGADYANGNPLIQDVQAPHYLSAHNGGELEASLARYASIWEAIAGDVVSMEDNRAWSVAWTKTMVDNGMLVGLGIDAPYTGNWTGESMHREMEIWVNESGVSPLRAIQAATYDNARIVKVDDRTGSIRPGLEGDLLVVEGNPAENISDTRNIRYVLSNGNIVDRESLTRQWRN